MSADEPQSKKPASPGRYSLATEGKTESAAVRIDSTRSMAAVRVERKPTTSREMPAVVEPRPASPIAVSKQTLRLSSDSLRTASQSLASARAPVAPPPPTNQP